LKNFAKLLVVYGIENDQTRIQVKGHVLSDFGAKFGCLKTWKFCLLIHYPNIIFEPACPDLFLALYRAPLIVEVMPNHQLVIGSRSRQPRTTSLPRSFTRSLPLWVSLPTIFSFIDALSFSLFLTLSLVVRGWVVQPPRHVFS